MNLPFGLSSYSRADGRLAPVRLINMFAEESPTSPGGGIVLLPRYGLNPLYSRANVRGIYREDGVFAGDLFVVAGTTLYRNNTSIGTVAGTDRVEFAYTVDGLFVLGNGIVYDTDGVTVTATSFPDAAAVASISQINSILLAVRRDTGTVYFRLPGDTVWGALDFFSAEREPDPAICVRALSDVVYVYGSSSIEPYVPTGDSAVPLQRLDGSSISRGLKDRDSVALLDNTLFHVGEDNIAYRLDSVPNRISNHGIEERIGLSATIKAFTFAQDGHTFYVMGLATETLVYDVSTGRWAQFTYNGGAFPNVGLYDGETAYIGGDEVWTLTNRSNDDGVAMERLFTSVAATNQPVTCDCIEIQLSPGVTEINDEPAVVATRFSDDQGRSWSDYQLASTGFGGQYRKRVRVRRLGMIDAPGRLFEHRITDDTNIRFSGVEMNPPMGGRSRP